MYIAQSDRVRRSPCRRPLPVDFARLAAGLTACLLLARNSRSAFRGYGLRVRLKRGRWAHACGGSPEPYGYRRRSLPDQNSLTTWSAGASRRTMSSAAQAPRVHRSGSVELNLERAPGGRVAGAGRLAGHLVLMPSAAYDFQRVAATRARGWRRRSCHPPAGCRRDPDDGQV